MKYLLTVRPEAELDIDATFEYYENQRIGLGHDFLLCVEAAISIIERNPTHYRRIHKELRRIAVHRFPYRIFFFIQDNRIIVTAVFHVRRDPQSWNTRT
jgi:plasmid stabilization system protein ParE